MSDAVAFWTMLIAVTFLGAMAGLGGSILLSAPWSRPPPLTCTCSCQDDVAMLEITEPTMEGKQ